MNYIVATFMLGIFSFINFILALITSTTYGYLKTSLWRASNLTNVTSQTMPLINQIETLFWILFLFSAVSTIVWYVIGSHQDEHESFSRPQEYNRRRY